VQRNVTMELISLTLRLDVDIGDLGIELVSIPNPWWYCIRPQFEFCCLDDFALPFRILGISLIQFLVWLCKTNEIEFWSLPASVHSQGTFKIWIPWSNKQSQRICCLGDAVRDRWRRKAWRCADSPHRSREPDRDGAFIDGRSLGGGRACRRS
jgi:hypothetical protein